MLISLRQLLDDAAEHGYGVPAFNINNMEQGLAILKAADRVDAPVIIQASRGARSAVFSLMRAVRMLGRRPLRIRRAEVVRPGPEAMLSGSASLAPR